LPSGETTGVNAVPLDVTCWTSRSEIDGVEPSSSAVTPAAGRDATYPAPRMATSRTTAAAIAARR
jgi:hypothetical protein